MRKLMISATGVAALAMVMAAAGIAAGGTRLNGTFDVVATIKDNDFGIDPGTKADQTYKFKSTCPSGSCKKVKLTRKDAGGTYKSTLQRTGADTYKGTEGPYPYPSCPDNNSATFTADHTIKITDVDGDEATKIAGRTNVQFAGCDAFSFVNYKLKGTLK